MPRVNLCKPMQAVQAAGPKNVLALRHCTGNYLKYGTPRGVVQNSEFRNSIELFTL